MIRDGDVAHSVIVHGIFTSSVGFDGTATNSVDFELGGRQCRNCYAELSYFIASIDEKSAIWSSVGPMAQALRAGHQRGTRSSIQDRDGVFFGVLSLIM